MALQKQPISINFSQGVQTKVDPFQIPIGEFQSLTNTVFNKDGLQEKRNGFGLLTNAPSNSQTLATLNGGLVVLGNTCESYSAENNTLTNAGTYQSLALSTLPVVRRSTSQTTADTGVCSNGIACSAWLDSDGNCYYEVFDSVTGQILVPATTLGSTATMPRVFAINTSLVVTYLITVSATTELQYIVIPTNNPTAPTTPFAFTNQVSGLTAGYDGYVFETLLVLAINCNDGGGAVRVFSSSITNLIAKNIPTPATIVTSASLISVTVDSSLSSPIYWVSMTNGTNVNAMALNQNLTTNLSVTLVSSGVTVNEITSTAVAGVLTVIYEVNNSYSYTPSAPQASNTKTDYLAQNTMTLGGTAGTASVILRGVGLASKAIISSVLNKNLVLATYGQTYQPTYFLIDTAGNVLARLAYSNGVGYLANQILPTINQDSKGLLRVGYLYADLIQGLNKSQGNTIAGVYASYGINLATFDLSGKSQGLEIAKTLSVSGGMLWQYDGQKIYEHGFNVWPEDIGLQGQFNASPGSMSTAQGQIFYQVTYEWTDAAGMIHRSAPSVPVTYTISTPPANFTGNRTSGSPTLASVSSFTGLQVGQAITGTGIPANTYILALNPGTTSLTMSANATSGTATSTTVTPSAVNIVRVSVPTLRQTYKGTNVRIVIYRWSTTQEIYYQVTSITSPLANNPSVDSVYFDDTFSDAQILGNNILYTAGNVIENICAPASLIMTLWQSRLFLVDAEDQNLIWYSKQVIEATPIEMSDLLTLYVAPTTGAQGSTGPITALSSMDDKLIIFKKDAIYYITGSGPDNTGASNGYSDPVFITSTVGSINQQSLVLMPNGIMFQSDKGIWLLGRDLATNYIGSAVEGYVNDSLVTSAVCVPATNQVRFTLNNRTAVMFDYFFNRWANWTNVDSISSVIYDSLQTYLSSKNQIVIETPGAYLDVSRPVLLGLTTGWINLAGLQGFERFYQGYLLGTFYSPCKLSVTIAYDYNPSLVQNIIVTPDNYSAPWGDDAVWGSGVLWGGASQDFKARFFPSIQKCEAFQITIQEVFDSSFNVVPGQGITLSGMNLVIGAKKGYRTQSAKKSFG